MHSDQVIQRIEFQCIIKDNYVYQIEQAHHFVSFRKRVIFNKQAKSVVLKKVQGLVFLTNSHWRMLARWGFF